MSRVIGRCLHNVCVSLCGYLTGPQGAQGTWSSIILSHLWGCFWVFLGLWITDWVKQIVFSAGDGPCLISQRPEWHKLAYPPGKRELPTPDGLALGCWLSPAFGLKLQPQLSWEDKVCYPCLPNILFWFLMTWFNKIISHIVMALPDVRSAGIGVRRDGFLVYSGPAEWLVANDLLFLGFRQFRLNYL